MKDIVLNIRIDTNYYETDDPYSSNFLVRSNVRKTVGEILISSWSEKASKHDGVFMLIREDGKYYRVRKAIL